MRVRPLNAYFWILLASICVATVLPARGHEIPPAYLSLTESAPGQFSVVWQTPVVGGLRLPIVLKLPDNVRNLEAPLVETTAGSVVERRRVDAGPDGLAGRRIEFPGLQLTTIDALVRIEPLKGRAWTAVAHPSEPWLDVAAARTRWQTAATYIVQGIRHILFGPDHLLFVLGLLFIVKGRMMLLKTITAFTLAHSITLGIATLGYASLPLPPLNAAIALSILFLGPEMMRCWRGETSLGIRYPWVVAFLFGLLHGFGFASGLSTAGMPRAEVPLALLCFNVGVEAGQLIFVFTALALGRSFRVLEVRWPRWVTALPAYTVGSLGAYWTIQRTLLLFR